MESLANRLKRGIGGLWAGSPVLTAAGLLMTGVLGVSAIGLVVDPRVITGAPAWLKPAKFAISTAIYMLTLAAIFSSRRGHARGEWWDG